MRLVVVDKNKCRPDKCGHECLKYCPVARNGKNIIEIGKIAKINEHLCIGCGICVHKCPFNAIHIVNLPEAEGNIVHRYLPNGFTLFGLPDLEGRVGLLGPNGTGKTTIVKILSGQLIPNLGKHNVDLEEIIERFSGTNYQRYFKDLYEKKIKVAVKPQEITKIPKIYDGNVKELLEKVDERNILDVLVEDFNIKNILDRKISKLSGGELQKIAIIATLLKDADLYFFDEPGSFLDIYERLRIAKIIEKHTKNSLIVEHDLLMLDYISENINILYGMPSVYGIVSLKKSSRVGINEYIEGYLKAENMRIRDHSLKFLVNKEIVKGGKEIIKFSKLVKKFEGFELEVEQGSIKEKEVIGIAGRNALGKSTFVKMIAKIIEPDEGKIEGDAIISYKPQYIQFPHVKVKELFNKIDKDKDINLNRDIYTPLNLTHLLDHFADELSGGEMQRVATGLALAKAADIYVLDEPSAYLDSEQRIKLSKLIRRLVQERGKSALVVEHDFMILDYISDRIIVFQGEPGKRGYATKPMDKQEAIKIFLKEIDITLRRDPQTKRPRVNKKGSQKDTELRKKDIWFEN